MKIQESKIKKTEKLNKQRKELSELRKNLKTKQALDIERYGVPLGSSVLEKRIEAKKSAINKTKESLKKIEDQLEKKFELSKRDSKVLDAIRGKGSVANTTSSDKGSRYDNRLAGSASSRRQARRYRP